MNGVKMNLPKQFIHQIYKFYFSVLIIMLIKKSYLIVYYLVLLLQLFCHDFFIVDLDIKIQIGIRRYEKDEILI